MPRLPALGPLRGLPDPTAPLRAVLGPLAAQAETAVALVPRVAALVARVERIADGAEQALARVSAVVEGAGGVVDRVNVVVGRSEAVLAAVEPAAGRLAPSLQRFADTLSPDEVDSVITIVDRMPALLRHLDEDVLPMLRQLDSVGPDVHELLETVQDLRHTVMGLPGMGLLRRRADADEDPPLAAG